MEKYLISAEAQFGKFEYDLQSIFGKFDYDLWSRLKKFKHSYLMIAKISC